MTRLIASAVLLIAVLYGSCLNPRLIKPDQEQIDEYIEQHPNLPQNDKAAIYNGRPDIGISDSTLLFLLGEPDDITVFKEPRLHIRQEIWTYKKKGWKFIVEDNGVASIEKTK